MKESNNENALLQVKNLQVHFHTLEGVTKAIDGVSFDLVQGEVFGLVGESGCGKSMTALSIPRLIPSPPGRIAGGEIIFDGEDLVNVSEERMRELRGKSISMIFQEPMTSLNPVITVGNQISEAILEHQDVEPSEAMSLTVDMLKMVGLSSPEKRVHEYPHRLSGGMRQRVMIAMALACRPKLLIADEPTTALDVTIQAQILDLMQKLQQEMSTAIILISHNLGVIAEMAERVGVMYAGKIVELANVDDIFRDPLHPYSQGLLKSIPRVDQNVNKFESPLHEIMGTVPRLINLPSGCKFEPRCPHSFARCRSEDPPLELKKPGHWARCWLQ